MLDSRAREVIRIGKSLLGKKRRVDSLFQELALNFYPERADFTNERDDGEEFAAHLFSSYPVLARRELGNMLGASLRPRSQKWFSIHATDESVDADQQARLYLEYITNIQWKAMYARSAMLTRATKQADHDFTTFGNAVIKITPNLNYDGLLYQNYHLRDCAWMENSEHSIDCMFRKWTPTAKQLMGVFPKTASKEVQAAFLKDPNKTFKCLHAVVPARMYGYKSQSGKRFPFVSLYVEQDSETVLEETGLEYFCYVVPRWQTVAGTVWGHSMATSIALPDGRTSQVVMRTLREAGEKYVDPPMLAVQDAIRGDVALYSGGITTVDMEYDERLGEVLRPITQNSNGMPIGFEIASALKEDIRSAFFLDKIQLPAPTSAEMTAFEVRRRMEEHIRAASPIFEPIEQEYNEPLCEVSFDILVKMGIVNFENMPESLQGQDVRYTFRSPLADMAEQQDAETFMDLMQRVWIPAAQIDPSQMDNIDLTTALRDAAIAGGWKGRWLRPIEQVMEMRQQAEEQAKAQQAMAEAQNIAQIMQQGGKGAESLNKIANG